MMVRGWTLQQEGWEPVEVGFAGILFGGSSVNEIGTGPKARIKPSGSYAVRIQKKFLEATILNPTPDAHVHTTDQQMRMSVWEHVGEEETDFVWHSEKPAVKVRDVVEVVPLDQEMGEWETLD